MIGILFATQSEALPFLRQYHRGRFIDVQEGDYESDDTVLVGIIGIGKIKAALRTERILRSEKLSRVIHVGTGTALSEDAPVGSLAQAQHVLEGDRIELSEPSYPRMPLVQHFEDVPSFRLITQDHAIREQEELTYWQRIADMVDMTGYAVAYVAATYGVPCSILKIITGTINTPDGELRKTRDAAYEKLGDFLNSSLAAQE